jgi:hypothetical protein
MPWITEFITKAAETKETNTYKRHLDRNATSLVEI